MSRRVRVSNRPNFSRNLEDRLDELENKIDIMISKLDELIAKFSK